MHELAHDVMSHLYELTMLLSMPAPDSNSNMVQCQGLLHTLVQSPVMLYLILDFVRVKLLAKALHDL